MWASVMIPPMNTPLLMNPSLCTTAARWMGETGCEYLQFKRSCVGAMVRRAMPPIALPGAKQAIVILTAPNLS